MRNKVGLVTVTYNSEHDIDEFIESCANQNHKDITLYIVDNNSSDNTLLNIENNRNKFEININFYQIKKNMGISYGNNFGIKKALEDNCDWVILINNDTAFDSNIVTLLTNQDNEVNTPLITYYDEPKKIWFYKGFFNKYKGFTGTHFMKNKFISDINFKKLEFTEYSPTCCMAIKSNIFSKVGLMDEDFFVYFDDTDFTYRLFKENIKIKINKDAILKHKVGSSTGGVMSDFTIEESSKNRIIFIRKHFSKTYLLLIMPVFIAFYFIRFILFGWSLKKFIISVRATCSGYKLKLSSPRYCD